MNAVTLYSYHRSSCSYRVRIGLYLKGIPFDYKAVHLLKSGGEQFQEDFKKINPFSQVPSLKHGERFLSQSLPLLLYLEELKSKPALLPENSFQKAKVLSFCEMINSGIQPLQNLSVLNYVDKKIQADKQQWAEYWIEEGLAVCESFLKPYAKDFCFGGDKPDLADCFLIPQLYNAQRFGVDIKNFPVLERVNKHCLTLSAFQKALPENQPDAPKKT